MIRAEYSRALNVSATLLFDYLSNPANDLHWQDSCVEARLLDGTTAIDSRYVIAFSFLGRRMNFECQITGVEAPVLYRFKVLQGSFHYEGVYHLEELPEGTRLSWQLDVEPGRFFGILPVSLVRKVLVAQVERDFSRLEALLQTAPAIKPKELIHV